MQSRRGPDEYQAAVKTEAPSLALPREEGRQTRTRRSLTLTPAMTKGWAGVNRAHRMVNLVASITAVRLKNSDRGKGRAHKEAWTIRTQGHVDIESSEEQREGHPPINKETEHAFSGPGLRSRLWCCRPLFAGPTRLFDNRTEFDVLRGNNLFY